MPRIDLETAQAQRYDLAVVDAGAAGLALAGAAKDAGLSVLLVERGGPEAASDPDEPEIAPGAPHDPSRQTIRQGLGGTLDIWGGRCVPFDLADFDRRPGGAPGWPIPYEDYARWIAPAARFLGVEPVFERAVPAHWPDVPGVRLENVERLGPGRLIGDLRRTALTDPDSPDLLLDLPVTGLTWTDRTVTGLEISTPEGLRQLPAARVALACGGLQTTRLLLLEEHHHPGRIAGSAALGRTYMGHLTGSIAEITFASATDAAHFAYVRDGDGGTPARRRFLMTPEAANHVAFWAENLTGIDPRHRSGELSLKALARGSARLSHMANVFGDPHGAAAGIASALRTRFLSQERHPTRLIIRGPGPYRLAYHAEHLPCTESRVRLSETTDTFGLPQLRIDFAYGAPTISGTVAAHRTLADALAASGFARLTLPGDDASLADAILAQARDGYHQIGLTRMADRPADGVVDSDAKVHGTKNLYVASASVFPVASQANPTLSVVAMALRLAERLVRSHSAARKPEMVT